MLIFEVICNVEIFEVRLLVRSLGLIREFRDVDEEEL